MKVARQLAVSSGAVIVMIGLAVWGLTRTSAPQLAIRWGFDGRPITLAERHVALLCLPAIAAVISLFLAAAPGLMPARSRIERSATAYTAFWMTSLLALVVGQLIIVAVDTGPGVFLPRPTGALIAVVLALTGNWMGKIRYNYLFGFRTPWTLGDERVWDKTHRFTGRVMVGAGVVLLVASFVLPGSGSPAPGPLFIAALLACSVVPIVAGVVYSAVISRSMQGKEVP